MSELIEKKDAYRIIKDMIGLVRSDVLMDAYDALKKLPTVEPASPWHRVEEPPKEEGMYIVAVFFSGHWIIDAAWFTHDISEIYCVPCEKKISGFYRGNHEVCPDYWMPIEPPKEDA